MFIRLVVAVVASFVFLLSVCLSFASLVCMFPLLFAWFPLCPSLSLSLLPLLFSCLIWFDVSVPFSAFVPFCHFIDLLAFVYNFCVYVACRNCSVKLFFVVDLLRLCFIRFVHLYVTDFCSVSSVCHPFYPCLCLYMDSSMVPTVYWHPLPGSK